MIPLPTVDALDAVTVPVPCRVPWNEMHGTDRTRYCDQCNQNVHDVSELTRAEAVQLLTAGDEPPRLRIYKRPDGRVMTADCITRRERAWKWLHGRSKWAAALFALVFFAGCDNQPKCVVGDAPPPPPGPQPVHEVTTQGAQSIVAGARYEVEYRR